MVRLIIDLATAKSMGPVFGVPGFIRVASLAALSASSFPGTPQ